MTTNKQALREEMREKFEAWAEEVGAMPWGYLKKQRTTSGNYSVQIYTYMWHSWSACHEALQDELEAAESLAKQQGHIAVALLDEVTTLRRNADDKAPELRSQLEEAEKWIAELDAREVREEVNQFLVVRHPGKAPVIKHAVGELDAYLRKLNEQDPLVTVDIITHRYYGVGGQFVQDGDEYLATAGITTKGE